MFKSKCYRDIVIFFTIRLFVYVFLSLYKDIGANRSLGALNLAMQIQTSRSGDIFFYFMVMLLDPRPIGGLCTASIPFFHSCQTDKAFNFLQETFSSFRNIGLTPCVQIKVHTYHMLTENDVRVTPCLGELMKNNFLRKLISWTQFLSFN